MSRTRRVLMIGAVAAAVAAPGHGSETGSRLARAVAAWLQSLDASQQGAASYGDDDSERFDLRLAPLGLEGLRGDAMNEAQWGTWLDALGVALSPEGRRKLETIMSLEREVERGDREAGFLRGQFARWVRGERRYFASVYGEPGGDALWGLRFDGHHLSLNWTEAGGEVSVTPLFLGAQPREVPEGWERAGLRVLAEEEDRGLAVWQALDAEQRAAAELPFEAASGLGARKRALFLGEGPRVEAAAPRGVAWRDLGPEARGAIDALIDVWLGNFAPGVAARQRARVEAPGRDDIHFAFAGSLQRGEPGYYRLQGPSFLIEWDDTAPAADHVHSVYRDFDGDYGRDLLAEHYARDHGVSIAHRREDD